MWSKWAPGSLRGQRFRDALLPRLKKNPGRAPKPEAILSPLACYAISHKLGPTSVRLLCSRPITESHPNGPKKNPCLCAGMPVQRWLEVALYPDAAQLDETSRPAPGTYRDIPGYPGISRDVPERPVRRLVSDARNPILGPNLARRLARGQGGPVWKCVEMRRNICASQELLMPPIMPPRPRRDPDPETPKPPDLNQSSARTNSTSPGIDLNRLA